MDQYVSPGELAGSDRSAVITDTGSTSREYPAWVGFSLRGMEITQRYGCPPRYPDWVHNPGVYHPSGVCRARPKPAAQARLELSRTATSVILRLIVMTKDRDQRRRNEPSPAFSRGANTAKARPACKNKQTSVREFLMPNIRADSGYPSLEMAQFCINQGADWVKS